MLPNKFLQKSARLKFCKTHEWVPPCPACYRCLHLSKRKQKVHIEYDLVGYIPVDELIKAEQA